MGVGHGVVLAAAAAGLFRLVFGSGSEKSKRIYRDHFEYDPAGYFCSEQHEHDFEDDPAGYFRSVQHEHEFEDDPAGYFRSLQHEHDFEYAQQVTSVASEIIVRREIRLALEKYFKMRSAELCLPEDLVDKVLAEGAIPEELVDEVLAEMRRTIGY